MHRNEDLTWLDCRGDKCGGGNHAAPGADRDVVAGDDVESFGVQGIDLYVTPFGSESAEHIALIGSRAGMPLR